MTHHPHTPAAGDAGAPGCRVAPGDTVVVPDGIDLRCQDVTVMIAGLPDGAAAFVIADPPWIYANGGPPMGMRRNRPNVNGRARAYYEGLDEPTIAAHLASTYRIAADDSYLAVWCTFPKLEQWLMTPLGTGKDRWRYVTGAAWGKTGGAWGVGYHFRGDAEICLFYRKGKPMPLEQSSNLFLSERGRHSEKPQVALRAFVRMAAPVGGLVVDLYAGESASLALACRATGRAYVGAEIDPARHALALRRLSQQEAVFVDAA